MVSVLEYLLVSWPALLVYVIVCVFAVQLVCFTFLLIGLLVGPCVRLTILLACLFDRLLG